MVLEHSLGFACETCGAACVIARTGGGGNVRLEVKHPEPACDAFMTMTDVSSFMAVVLELEVKKEGANG